MSDTAHLGYDFPDSDDEIYVDDDDYDVDHQYDQQLDNKWSMKDVDEDEAMIRMPSSSPIFGGQKPKMGDKSTDNQWNSFITKSTQCLDTHDIKDFVSEKHESDEEIFVDDDEDIDFTKNEVKRSHIIKIDPKVSIRLPVMSSNLPVFPVQLRRPKTNDLMDKSPKPKSQMATVLSPLVSPKQSESELLTESAVKTKQNVTKDMVSSISDPKVSQHECCIIQQKTRKMFVEKPLPEVLAKLNDYLTKAMDRMSDVWTNKSATNDEWFTILDSNFQSLIFDDIKNNFQFSNVLSQYSGLFSLVNSLDPSAGCCVKSITEESILKATNNFRTTSEMSTQTDISGSVLIEDLYLTNN